MDNDNQIGRENPVLANRLKPTKQLAESPPKLTKIANKHFELYLKIDKYYKFGFPYYNIQKMVYGNWYNVAEFTDLKLAKAFKNFLEQNPDLVTNPHEVKKYDN